MNWRDLAESEIEFHFNPRAGFADFQRVFDRWAALSEAARRRLPTLADLRYGAGPLQTLDLHGAGGGPKPVLVFIHGGYWRALDKRDVSFVAAPFVERGAVVCNLNYDLCPQVTLDRVVAEIHEAIAWIWRKAPAFGGDRDRIFLAGHSAGAHLAVMCLTHDWRRAGLPAQPIKGVAAVSGVYELEPVLKTTINAEIRLDLDMARRNSPTLAPPRSDARLLVAVGDAEPDGWIGQSADFHAACRSAGQAADLWRLAGENHFTIMLPLADARHPLTHAILRQMEL
jgi:arylformamidase